MKLSGCDNLLTIYYVGIHDANTALQTAAWLSLVQHVHPISSTNRKYRYPTLRMYSSIIRADIISLIIYHLERGTTWNVHDFSVTTAVSTPPRQALRFKPVGFGSAAAVL